MKKHHQTQISPPSPALNAPRIFPHCRLRQIRKRLGLTRVALAAKLRMSHSNLWKIDEGSDVKLSYARRIARACGKTVDEIWPDEYTKKTAGAKRK